MTTNLGEAKSDEPEGQRVVYLLGAGATQGCVDFAGTAHKLMMAGLAEELGVEMRALVEAEYPNHAGVARLVNEVVDETTDFEQLITFLEDAPSDTHRRLATHLKGVFAKVLRERLDQVEEELGDKHSRLYATLVDMHQVNGLGERLAGFLTLNYDLFLDHAIESTHGYGVDHGLAVNNSVIADQRIRVLKLHGSFGWASDWPVEASNSFPSLWIPPGIRKQKAEYPFNLIWGLARELLDCDILRVIGCNLGANDWDLVSLLFTTMHTHAMTGPYRIEMIGRPATARRIARRFPYLEVRSLLELADVGPAAVAENLGGEPRDYDSLTAEEQEEVLRHAHSNIKNGFEYWLRLKGEHLMESLSLETSSGLFQQFVEVD